jgi:hypothetical protein
MSRYETMTFAWVGPTTLSWQSGGIWYNDTANEVTTSPVMKTSFLLVPCLAINQVPATQQLDCVSFMLAGYTNWYLRHYAYILYAQLAPSPLDVYLDDSSFMIRYDRFNPATVSFESVNLHGYYITVHSDNLLGIDVLIDNIAFATAASFF